MAKFTAPHPVYLKEEHCQIQTVHDGHGKRSAAQRAAVKLQHSPQLYANESVHHNVLIQSLVFIMTDDE